jgi:PAS domain S-box-containing protein
MDRAVVERYQDIIDCISDPVLIIDNNCRISAVNDALLTLQEESRERIIGKFCHSVLHHQDLPCRLRDEKCPFNDVVHAGKSVKVVHRHFNSSGGAIIVELTASPLRDGDGAVIGMLEVMRDVTAAARMEEENSQSLAFLSSVLEGIGEGVVVMDREYRILSANRGYLNQVGKERDAVIGKPCYVVSHHFDSPCEGRGHECPVRRVFESGLPARAMHVHYDHDDRQIYVECHAYPIRGAAGEVTRAIETLNDVTERVLLEQKLKDSEEKYRDLYDHAPDGYYSLARNGLIVEVNTTFLSMLGYTREDVVQKMFIEDLLSDDSAGLCHKYFPELMKVGWMENLELTLKKKDGSLLPIVMNASAVYDADGNFVMSRSVIRDITERKKADEEKRRLSEQLFQSQKLEALGTLAGGIAHDFNNLLASILGYASLAKTDLSKNDPLYNHVDIIETAAMRGSELTQQLLAFAKGGKYDAQPNNVNIIVREVAALLSRTIDKNITVKVQCDDDLRPVICDAGQIQQALLNLCINSRDAMPEGGSLTIRTRNLRLDIKDVEYLVEVPPGDYVCISVSDTGIGIDKQTQRYIFDPFFTTKVKGTGLGLSLVYGIIKKHNGFIQVHSEPGKGATFHVYLTACPEGNTCAEPRAPAALKRGSGTVLVVDDEPLVRQLARDILQRFGYTVLMAAGGQEAITLYEERFRDISVVVLDIVMPDMNGREVFERLREVNPDAAIIVSSGYTHDRDADDLLAQGAASFIQKPYRIADLVRVVNEAISERNKNRGPETAVRERTD